MWTWILMYCGVSWCLAVVTMRRWLPLAWSDTWTAFETYAAAFLWTLASPLIAAVLILAGLWWLIVEIATYNSPVCAKIKEGIAQQHEADREVVQ